MVTLLENPVSERVLRPACSFATTGRKEKAMKNMPCFLIMSAFLAVFIGCQASTSPLTTPKTTYASTVAPPVSKPKDVGRQERRQMEFNCFINGEFNVSSDGQTLSMKTGCIQDKPDGDTIAMLRTNDTKVNRIPGKEAFRSLCRNASLTVRDQGNGQLQVYLHYRDATGIHHFAMSPRPDKEYRYSFAELVPETVHPIGESRLIEIERAE